MVFQPSSKGTHDHDTRDDRLRSRQRSRLDRMFSRRAQKATTYHRLQATPRAGYPVLGRQAV